MAESESLHGAIRVRFAAYRAGLLDAESAFKLRVHLRACADCRAAFEEFADRASEEEAGCFGHVPVALLARWDAAIAPRPEAERALLEAHVSTCAACADALQFARRMRATPPRARWRGRAGFIAAGTAALVASLLVVVLRDTAPLRPPANSVKPHAPGQVQPGAIEARAPVTVSPNAFRRAVPVQLGRTTRGGADQVVRVPKGTTRLPLCVPPLLGVGPEAHIRIDVTGPGGADYGHTDLEHRKLFGETPPPAVEATAPDGGALPTGHYDVSAVSDAPDPTAPGSFERASYGFDLKLLLETTAP